MTSSDDGEAVDLLASLVIEDGRRWGQAATEWQWRDARTVLASTPQAPYAFLTRPRGGSKTTDLAGMVLAAILTQLPKHSHCYALAADRDQGRLLLDAVEGFIRRTPGLSGAFSTSAWRISYNRAGSALEVLAADAPGAWGLRPAFVVVDELAQWAETPASLRLWEAVSTSVAKLSTSRLVVLTTAGDPSHFAHAILDHAIADPSWVVNELPGPIPWLEPERLREQQERLPESSYRRLFLNQWVAAEDSLARPEDLAACASLDGPLDAEPGRSYMLGVDIGLKHDRTAIAVAHRDADGGQDRVVLDRMGVWSGDRESPVRLNDVEDWLIQAGTTYGPCRIIIDPWQAVGLMQRLRSRGCSVEEFTFTAASAGRLASTLHMLIRDRRLIIPRDEALLDELAAVRLRETSPGVVRMDHASGKHDDRAIALALAAYRLLEEPGPIPDFSRGLAEVNRALSQVNPWVA